jgi:hypothetical protein
MHAPRQRKTCSTARTPAAPQQGLQVTLKSMFKWVAAPLVIGILASGCSSPNTSTTVATQPSSFAPPAVSETFTGSLTTSGTDSHPFNVPVPGEVDVTLTALNPQPTPAVALTLAIGLPSSTVVGQCATIQSVSATPGATPQITGHALAGNFCVSVSDTGNLASSVTYTVIVAHP